MEDLLKSYAKKRQDEAGDSFQLHPATRRLLQGEVARTRPKPASDGRSWLSALLFSPRLVGAAAVVLVLGVGYWSFVEQQSPNSAIDDMARLPEIAESVPAPAPASDAFFAETLDRAAPSSTAAKDALTVLSGDARAGESRVLLEQKSKDSTMRFQEKVGRNETESLKREALSELETAGVRLAEDKSVQLATPKPADSEVLQLGKQFANQPAPARELDGGFTPSRAVSATTLSEPQSPAAPQPGLAPARLDLARDEPLGSVALGKEAELSAKVASPDPASGLVVPPSLQLDSARSLAFLFDSSDADRFSSTTEPITNFAFALVAPARSFTGDSLSSWSFAESNAPGFLTNSAFGLSHLASQQAGAFSNRTPAPASTLQAARPVTSSGSSPIENGIAQASTPSGSYLRLNTLADAKADQGQRQLFRQLTKAQATPLGDRNGPGGGEVLSSFEFQQWGERARVIDADGSVYEGQLLASSPESPAAARKPEAATRSVEGLAATGAPANRQRFGGAVPGSSQANLPRFRLTGTNRTLRQMVVFEGSFVTAEAGGVGGVVADETTLAKKLAERRAAPPIQSGPVVTNSTQQIRGTVRVGAGNTSPVEAVPVDN